MKRNVLGWGAAAVLAAAVASPASARPPYLQAFKDQYKVTAASKPRINPGYHPSRSRRNTGFRAPTISRGSLRSTASCNSAAG